MMNIVYLHTHDSGRLIQPYGYALSTPHLSRLAHDGTLFRHAFSCAPTCSPSRAALLTGMNPHSAGMLGLVNRGFQMKRYDRHIVQFLGNHGYETALFGIQHEARSPSDIGYHSTYDSDGSDGTARDLANAHAAAQYLMKHQGAPFFMSFGMFNTHRPYPKAAPGIETQYLMPPFVLPDVEDTRSDFAEYMTSIQTVDECVGIVMDAISRSGKGEDTLIIFTTDHGPAFPFMKCNLYDTGIGVSLILKFPNNPSRGAALDALVSHLDIFPTICDAANIEKPEWLEGASLLPLLQQEVDHIRREIFAEVTYHAAYEPMRCIRTERYKLIRFFDQHERAVPANIDDSLSKAFVVKAGLLQQKRQREILLDLYLDPMERVNIVQEDYASDIYADLVQRLDRWMEETQDPLLNGRVPRPEEARINTLSCLSPNDDDFEEM